MEIQFTLSAAALTLVALAFLLVPLLGSKRVSPSGEDLRRQTNVDNFNAEVIELDEALDQGRLSQAEYDELMLEAKRSLLADDEPRQVKDARKSKVWPLALAVCIITVLVAFSIYHKTGGVTEIALRETMRELSRNDLPADQMQPLISQLSEQASKAAAQFGRKKPDYVALAAQTAMNLEHFAEAADYYQQLVDEYPGDAGLLGFLAQAEYLAADRQMTPRVNGLIARTLAIDPHQTTVLGLQGMHAFMNGDYASAIVTWRKVLVNVPPMAEVAQVMKGGIAEAERLLTEQGLPIPEEEVSVANSGGVSLKVAVSLSQQIEADLRLSEGAVLFVFAKAASGPPMPLAVARLDPRTLPVEVELNDAMAMTPAMRLSQFEDVVVSAKISQAGSVATVAGDYLSSAVAVHVADAPDLIAVEINEIAK